MEKLRGSFREVLRYPTALVGLAIVLALVLTAAWAVIKIPYRQAVALWGGGAGSRPGQTWADRQSSRGGRRGNRVAHAAA